MELASILPRETELGKSLMQGDKSGALPAPPTPELLNVFVATKDQWGSLSTLMVEAVEGEDLPEAPLAKADSVLSSARSELILSGMPTRCPTCAP